MPGWETVRWFRSEEFDSPDEPGSGMRMQLAVVEALDRVRTRVGRPLVITSGYRTAAHNARVGGVAGSAHRRGLAADVKALGAEMRYAIVAAALAEGFTRIGIGSTFVHLDRDETLPAPVLWLY